jgi:hypothetical protein
MVCTQAYVTAIREQAFVGAAAGKMSAVVLALRQAGRRAVLVSLPFVGRGADRQQGRVCRDDGFPAYFLPVRRAAVARKVHGFFTLAWFALQRVRPRDTVLFYNHGLEYLMALLIMRLRGIAVFQDIEDVPTSIETGLRGVTNRFGYRLMSALSSPRKVTVSNQVGRSLALNGFLAIQGIAAVSTHAWLSDKWSALAAGAPLRVHFGGTLNASTGLDLFCATLTNLDSSAGRLDRNIVLIVTGTGDLDKVRDLATSLQSDRLVIEVHREIDRHSYFNLLHSCHIGLSLKSPDADLADTTFPSKVIEITSRGLALVSTRVSDVGDIFSDEEAWLLPQFDVTELTEALLHLAAHPDEVRRRAEAGQVRARERFAPLAVGRALADFLDAGPSAQ